MSPSEMPTTRPLKSSENEQRRLGTQYDPPTLVELAMNFIIPITAGIMICFGDQVEMMIGLNFRATNKRKGFQVIGGIFPRCIHSGISQENRVFPIWGRFHWVDSPFVRICFEL